MKYLALGFTGPSGSGKTSSIVKVSKALQKEFKVAIIKHDPGDKAEFDTKHKDSWKFAQTGAEVVVTSPTRTTLFLNSGTDLDHIINALNPFDFLIVEGLKTLPLPKIGIFREEIQEDYLPYCKAIAVKDVDLDKYKLPKELAVLDLDDIDSIVEWIKHNSIKVK